MENTVVIRDFLYPNRSLIESTRIHGLRMVIGDYSILTSRRFPLVRVWGRTNLLILYFNQYIWVGHALELEKFNLNSWSLMSRVRTRRGVFTGTNTFVSFVSPVRFRLLRLLTKVHRPRPLPSRGAKTTWDSLTRVDIPDVDQVPWVFSEDWGF